MDAENKFTVIYLFSAVSARIVWVMAIVFMVMIFRVAVTAQAITLLALAFLAGLALSGSGLALDVHMFGGGATLLMSAVQSGAAVLLRRAARIPGWSIAASLGVLVADVVQMAAGRLQLLALHFPLGVALFGASVGLLIYAWAWRPTQSAVAPSQGLAGDLTLEKAAGRGARSAW
jgi:hypothetical protein